MEHTKTTEETILFAARKQQHTSLLYNIIWHTLCNVKLKVEDVYRIKHFQNSTL
jgi:hypothetical protein